MQKKAWLNYFLISDLWNIVEKNDKIIVIEQYPSAPFLGPSPSRQHEDFPL